MSKFDYQKELKEDCDRHRPTDTWDLWFSLGRGETWYTKTNTSSKF